MFGPGRKAEPVAVEAFGELTPEAVKGLTARGRPPAVKRFRDSHHRVARLFAMGLRVGEVAEETGYAMNRVSVLHCDPAFQALIAEYRQTENAAFAENRDTYYATANKAKLISARMLLDQLEEADEVGEKIPIGTLLRIQSDMADRTGHPKRTDIRHKMDFAAQLDLAIEHKQKLMEPKVVDITPEPERPHNIEPKIVSLVRRA